MEEDILGQRARNTVGEILKEHSKELGDVSKMVDDVMKYAVVKER